MGFIFRGQTNSFVGKGVSEWKLVSSFNRKYPLNFYEFSTFLRQQLSDDLFKLVYSSYKFKAIKYLIDCTLLERLYYLQHFGVPTCLLDFTKNPLIALYFAISGILCNSGGMADENDDLVLFPENCYMTIYAININRIIYLLNIQELSSEKLKEYYKYFQKEYVFVGYDSNPSQKISNPRKNYNLSKQESFFLLYDNSGVGESFDFITYLNCELAKIDRKFDEILIHKFKLDYNSVFKLMDSSIGKSTIFGFLHANKCTGKFLFNDIQGLKTDLNFFHHD